MNNYILVAVPMFVFMATVLAGAGIVDDLFDAIFIWAGPVRGGLAVATVIVSTIMAAMVGIIGATEVTMGLVALPAMLKRNYSKSIALGCVCAGGSLGYLIPPSVVFILYGVLSSESVGKLFMGGVIPGLLLSTLYIAYIIIRCYFQPDIAPPLNKDDREIFLTRKISALRKIILPSLLVLSVLGTIYYGIASITEASGIGALGAVLISAINRKLTLKSLIEAALKTITVTSMVFWLCVGSSVFISVYTGVGGINFAKETIVGLPFGKWGILICMQLFLMFLGCFIDWVGILMLTLPIFLPIVKSLGFDPVWYGVLFNVNMQIATMTPPFGMSLFYLKGVSPQGVHTTDIYRSIWPYILIQIFVLILLMIFPQIALWLPEVMKG
jgi:tripartite ATP-independent transporter DctM subunit